ncbi:MAG: trans-sulfuration enzyme family protein [Acidimicrobiia bacterium]
MPEPPLDTVLAQAGGFIDRETGAIVPPVHPATTFARDAEHELYGEFLYGRYSSPTIELVEDLVTRLEGGAAALAFASGLGGAAAVFETVPSGAHVAAPTVMYHGTQDWLRRVCVRRGIDLTLFGAAETDALAGAVRPGATDLVWIETPVNPTWDVVDIAAAAEVAHTAGAVLAVDGTVAPPVTTRALDLGADLVFHAATKYLNGHSDVGAGLVVTRDTDDRWSEMGDIRRLSGGVLGPFEAWLLLRGMRTLHLRFERASDTALAIARHFEGHARLEAVLYPGLESHPGHAVAVRQMTGGFGGMISLLVDGDDEATRAIVGRTRVFVRATSLGGVESLIEHRKGVEGPNSIVPGNLIRISVGIEAAGDLIADLEQALAD